MTAALQNYRVRMRRVLAHIDRHLDDDLDLATLSGVAAFSKFHFHRQFLAIFGLSVHRYIQLARMKRASYRLAYVDAESVTEIAMDAGYDAPDVFACAFRQRFGQSPPSFRNAPEWEPWLAAFGPLDIARSKLMQTTCTIDDVTIRDVAATRVAIMEHGGDPATLPATLRRFIAWRKATGLHPSTSPTLNVWRSERRPGRHGLPITASISASTPTGRSPAMASRPARSPAAAAPWCAWPATPIISSPPRSISTATGFRPAARRRATSRSIASG